MKKKCLGGFFLECSILPDVSLGERSPKVVKCIPLEALEIIGLGRCCLGSCHGLWVIKARHMGGRCSCGGKIEGELSSSYELWQGQLKKITKIYIYISKDISIFCSTFFILVLNKIKDSTTRQETKSSIYFTGLVQVLLCTGQKRFADGVVRLQASGLCWHTWGP